MDVNNAAQIDKLTAHNLTDFLQRMQDGDKLIMVKNGESIKFFLQKPGSEDKIAVKSSIITGGAGFTHMRSSWVATPPSTGGFPSWRDFGKKVTAGKKKPGNKSAEKSSLILKREAFEFGLPFVKEYDIVSTPNGTYWRFMIAGEYVYCTPETKKVVFYEKPSEPGKFISLPQVMKLEKTVMKDIKI